MTSKYSLCNPPKKAQNKKTRGTEKKGAKANKSQKRDRTEKEEIGWEKSKCDWAERNLVTDHAAEVVGPDEDGEVEEEEEEGAVV